VRAPSLADVPDPNPVRCTAEAGDDTLTLRPEGELDIAGKAVLDSTLERNLDDYGSLVVDLRGLQFMDCAGVHLLLRWAGDAADAGRRFCLLPGPERVQRVVAVTGVGAALGLEGTAPA
jgi:anti-anti-sigma factor